MKEGILTEMLVETNNGGFKALVVIIERCTMYSL
jgi:hypothetical protein